ncbi:sugar fermentation stimulation protein [Kordiimonas sediminis]|uniref:Sugar fermentation stimulation protein homolog n=1 Tax=Kordiimonas sediminis TaxID=1735581 RepID=A0A919AYB6_9PROT|nr:DNA/RNA nuclease SfsA [Kordiimonas sediminis]GHF31087.1 sugar fermentation stimulation protein [Kordiimonas sediminis]
MKFEGKLTKGILIKRYKRFLADIQLADGSIITAHCANSGSMMGLKEPGSTVWLSPNTNPKAKLDWRWEMVEADGVKVGINTSRPNHIVEEAILAGKIPELTDFETLRREVKYGQNSRIDLLLEGAQSIYVEVKNVTLKVGEEARFPDAVTARGTKHLLELIDMVAAGHRAVMVYLVQRPDCEIFTVARDIDPAYAEALKAANEAGVELLCYKCKLDETEISVDTAVKINL